MKKQLFSGRIGVFFAASLMVIGVMSIKAQGAVSSCVTPVQWNADDENMGNMADAGGDAAGAAPDAATSEEWTLTPKIKTALAANAALENASINVDTDLTRNTITLSGTTRNWPQIRLASQIAKQNAPGYAIINQLHVQARQSTLRRSRHRKRRVRTHHTKRRRAKR
jgi:osmotically-inducible protein OsmY